MSLFQQVHSDILCSINGFLNAVDRFYLIGTCQRFRNYFKEEEKPTLEKLIEYGYLDLLKNTKIDFNKYGRFKLVENAIQYGHLEIVKYFFFVRECQEKEKKFPLDIWICRQAANYGQLSILQWLRQNECPWDEAICHFATLNGHFKVLQWARENGCPWNGYACSCAAVNGHFEILKWARENGAPWNKWVCCYAAEGGYLEMLKWARSEGCPWDRERCLRYITDAKIIEWINSN